MPRIIAQSADFSGQVFELTGDTVTVGRSDQNQIHLPHSSVSGKHAMFQLDQLDYIVKDLGSTNGTRVNGDRISGEVKLRRNDTLSFGNIDFHYDSEHLPPGRPLPELFPGIDVTKCSFRAKPPTYRNASPIPKTKASSLTPAWKFSLIGLLVVFLGGLGYLGFVLLTPPSS